MLLCTVSVLLQALLCSHIDPTVVGFEMKYRMETVIVRVEGTLSIGVILRSGVIDEIDHVTC